VAAPAAGTVVAAAGVVAVAEAGAVAPTLAAAGGAAGAGGVAARATGDVLQVVTQCRVVDRAAAVAAVVCRGAVADWPASVAANARASAAAVNECARRLPSRLTAPSSA
jgi:hypothetical protein